jgi:hypothetical protein
MFTRSMKAWKKLFLKEWRNNSKILPQKLLLPIHKNKILIGISVIPEQIVAIKDQVPQL